MKFRKKPIVVEAIQWFSGIHIFGVYKKISDHVCLKFNVAYIKILEGEMKVNEGDWIITGINGERYPCKPDIFEKTYEKVEQEK
jgi:hypothetical protein